MSSKVKESQSPVGDSPPTGIFDDTDLDMLFSSYFNESNAPSDVASGSIFNPMNVFQPLHNFALPDLGSSLDDNLAEVAGNQQQLQFQQIMKQNPFPLSEDLVVNGSNSYESIKVYKADKAVDNYWLDPDTSGSGLQDNNLTGIRKLSHDGSQTAGLPSNGSVLSSHSPNQAHEAADFVFGAQEDDNEDADDLEDRLPTKHQKKDKHQATLEKNRRAQKRFREKQKEKMQSLEGQVSQLRDQLSKLSTENKELQNQREILQQALRFKDCLVQSLRETEVTSNKEQKLHEVFGLENSCPKQCLDPNGDSISVERVKTLSQAEVCGYYKQWVQLFTNSLVQLDSSDKSQRDVILDKVSKDVKNMSSFLSKLCIYNYGSIVKMLVFNLETLEPISKSDCAIRKEAMQLLESLRISEQQKDKLHALFNIFKERKQEKIKLLQQSTQLVTLEFHQLKNLNDKCGIIRQNVGHKALKFHEAANKFKSLVEEVQFLHSELHGTIMFQILDSVQLARMCVKSYPEFPNVIALTCVIHQAVERRKGAGTHSDQNCCDKQSATESIC